MSFFRSILARPLVRQILGGIAGAGIALGLYGLFIWLPTPDEVLHQSAPLTETGPILTAEQNVRMNEITDLARQLLSQAPDGTGSN